MSECSLQDRAKKYWTKEKRVFFKEIDVRDVVEPYRKWKNTDYRRKLFLVRFSDGSVWYPRDDDVRLIVQAKEHVFKHNTKYRNIDEAKK